MRTQEQDQSYSTGTRRRQTIYPQSPGEGIASFLQTFNENNAKQKEADRQQQLKDMIFRAAAGGKLTPSYKINDKGEAEASYSTPKASTKNAVFPGAPDDFERPDASDYDMTTKEGREEYLSAYPKQTQYLVKQLIKGTPITALVGGMGGTGVKTALQGLAGEYTAGKYDPTKSAARVKYQTGLASTAPSTVGGQRNSIQTAIDHLKALHDDGLKLHNSSFTPWNKGAQWVSSMFGNAAPNNYRQDGQALAGELSKLYAGNFGSQKEIEDWKNTMSPSASPEQQQGSYDTAVRLMAGKADALRNQYQDTMDETPPVSKFFTQNNQKDLSDLKLTDQMGLNDPTMWKQEQTDQSPYNAALGASSSTPRASTPKMATYTDPKDVETDYKSGKISHGDTIMLNGKPFKVQDDEE